MMGPVSILEESVEDPGRNRRTGQCAEIPF